MSIRQNHHKPRLPDFGNLGVMLRSLLAVNLLALFAVLARNESLVFLPRELAEMAAWVEPPLIACVALLAVAAKWLEQFSYGVALGLIAVFCAPVAAVFSVLLSPPGLPWPEMARAVLWGLAACAAVLFYFDLRSRAFSPALAEARLLALTARIRPHFLFNSLNAVLGVMRSDARRAEQALEELADLFRVLMAENKKLVTLGEELALCRQYLDIETLRLGDRLQVLWDMEGCPMDAQVPPLMLQPLLENAVYHGVEPSAQAAQVRIRARRRGEEIRIRIDNPYHGENAREGGNRMALANIRERLMLFYDLEARLDTEAKDGRYRVAIRLPYRTDRTNGVIA